MTGLLFSIYVKLFLPSNFNSADICSSISCIILNSETVDKIIFGGLGVLNIGNVQEYTFCLQEGAKRNKPTKQAFSWTRNLHRNERNKRRLDHNELVNNLPRIVNGEHFSEGTEKRKTLGISLDKELENLSEHGCPNVEDLADNENLICSSFHSDTRLHFTVQSEKKIVW